MNRSKIFFWVYKRINNSNCNTSSSRIFLDHISKCLNYSSTLVNAPTSTVKSPLDIVNESDLVNYGSVLKPTYNFAAYADKSVLLQELIKLGVNLHKIEKNPDAANFIIKLDLEKNVKPYLLFLHDNGVPADQMGNFITINPFIFKEDLRDLETRLNYLKSKKFDQNMISTIITKNPKWLSISVRNLDERLGFIQQTFELKGDDVRAIVTKVPKLVIVPKKKIMTNSYVLKEEMNLNKHELKKLIKTVPSLLKKGMIHLLY